MAFPASGSFDYWLGGRPAVTLARTTGDFDYWLVRPIAVQASLAAVAGNIKTFNALAIAATKTWDGLTMALLKTWNGLSK